MILKIKSVFTLVIIHLHRLFDHSCRWLTGLPTLSRSEITPLIYLGGQYNSRGLTRLKKYGVTAIVNMRMSSIPEYARASFNTLHLPTPDRHAPTMEDLQKGIAFIDAEVKAGGKVYVHCWFGEGRGPSMVIAYLMSTGLTFEDAYKLVRSIRRFVLLTPPQQDRLRELETVFNSQNA